MFELIGACLSRKCVKIEKVNFNMERSNDHMKLISFVWDFCSKMICMSSCFKQLMTVCWIYVRCYIFVIFANILNTQVSLLIFNLAPKKSFFSPSVLKTYKKPWCNWKVLFEPFLGIFIIISPSFVIGNELMPVPSGTNGRVFCIFLQKNLFVWYLAKCSIAIVMCMSIERWYALAHPHKYKYVFTAKKVAIYATFITMETFAVFFPTFYLTYVKTEGSKNICVSKTIFEDMLAHQLYIIAYCIVTAFIPCVVILLSYLHLRCSVIAKQQPTETYAQKRRRQLESSLTKMNAIAAFVLSVCIFPSQVTLVLYNFNLVSWDVVNMWSILSTINSVVNPWIYCLTNKVYRKEFARLLCFCRRRDVAPIDHSLQTNTDCIDTK